MDNNVIVSLKGPERVRKRPAVIFTSDGIEGANYAVKMLLDMFITEAALGFSQELIVTINKDNAVRIKSFDRGFILDETLVDGKAIWEYDFCELYAAPRHKEEGYYFSLGYEKNHNEMYGAADLPFPKYRAGEIFDLGLCCVQYASEYMEVEAVHKNIRKHVSFKKGYCASKLTHETTTSEPYTLIEFKLDKDVFSDITITYNSLASVLKYAAMTIPGFKTTIEDERSSETNTYLYPEGIIGYAKEKTDGVSVAPFYVKEIETVGKDRYNRKEYDARIKVVLSFSCQPGLIECIHNYGFLEYGGNHLRAGIDSIKKTVDWRLLHLDGHPELTIDDICGKMILILETNCSSKATCWENATKKAITNKMITDMCVDLFDDDFCYYIEKNKEAIISVLK